MVRTGVIYFLVVVAMHLLGRRVAAYAFWKISIAAALAATTRVPLQAVHRGMLRR